MTVSKTNKTDNFGRKFLIYSNIIILSLSVFVIIGWIFDISILKSLHTNSVYVKIIETAALTFASIILITYRNHKDSALLQIFKTSFIWFVFLVGVFSIAIQFFSLNLDLDKFFFNNLIRDINGNYLQNISPTTSFGFILLAVSLYFLNIKKNIWFSQTLLTIIFFISLFALFGHLINVNQIHGIFAETPMSFYSSLSLSSISFGAILLEPNKGLGLILLHKGITGRLFRNTLAVIVLVPISGFILFGFIGLAAQIEYEIAVFTIIIILSSAVGLYVNSKLSLKKEKLIDELEEDNKKLSIIVENAADIVGTMNVDGDFTFINPAGRRILKLEEEEVVNFLNISNFIYGKDDCEKIFYEHIPEALEEGSSEILCKIINRDGIIIPVSLSFISHKSFQDDVDYISIIARDITEQQTAKKDLQKSEKKYRTLFDKNKAGVYESTINGKIINCNDSFIKMYGYSSKEELLNTPSFNFYPDQFSRNNFLELLRKEKQLLNYESQTRRKDGSLIWTLENVHLIGDNIIQGTVIDITEHKNTLKKLLEEIELNKSLISTIPFGMNIVDLDGNVLFVNDVLKEKVGIKDPKGKCWDYYKDDKKQCAECPLKLDLPKGEVMSINVDGTLGGREFEVTHSRMIYNGKEAMLEIFRDVTDIKKARQMLINAKEKAEGMNSLKSKFLTNISHKLRTPLIGIHGYSEILFEESASKKHKEMAASILESSKNLEEILNTILDFTLIEANKYDLSTVPTNISLTVSNTVNSFLKAAEKKSLLLIGNIKDENITAQVDNDLLVRLLNNLINNALKYTKKGTVEVGLYSITENNEQLAKIYVKDTGTGIEKEYLSHIFDEFKHGAEANDRLYRGTGLGLTLVNKIVGLMDGSISVESKLGEGTTFTIKLQATEPKKILEDKKEETIIKEKAPTIGKVPQILYVEDDPNSRTVVGLFLKNKYNLTIVEKATAALHITNRKLFDLIMMDINLGVGMNGLDLAQEIKKNSRYKDVPIAAVTANAVVGDKKRYLEKGCTHYIAKPFSKETLINFISAIVEKSN